MFQLSGVTSWLKTSAAAMRVPGGPGTPRPRDPPEARLEDQEGSQFHFQILSYVVSATSEPFRVCGEVSRLPNYREASARYVCQGRRGFQLSGCTKNSRARLTYWLSFGNVAN